MFDKNDLPVEIGDKVTWFYGPKNTQVIGTLLRREKRMGQEFIVIGFMGIEGFFSKEDIRKMRLHFD